MFHNRLLIIDTLCNNRLHAKTGRAAVGWKVELTGLYVFRDDSQNQFNYSHIDSVCHHPISPSDAAAAAAATSLLATTS